MSSRKEVFSELSNWALFSLALLGLAATASCGGGNSTAHTTPQTPQPPPVQPLLPVWTNNFDGVPFTMVGTDPSNQGAGTTTVPVIIIPVRLSFSLASTVLTPESMPCGDGTSAITRVTNSPIFTNNNWTDGPVIIGQTQFPDAFQRANFWKYVGTISPNYHVLLQPVSVQSPITAEVPLNSLLVGNPNPACPQRPIGQIPIEFMTSIVQNAVTSQHITADTLPIFLTYDVSFRLSNGGFFLGYHNVLPGNQTYVVASYNDPLFNGIPGYSVSDIAVLSHELGEWMDNPLGVNKVPSWGRFGIQPTCGTDLEVGDPLTDHIYPMFTQGFTYHLQELAYFSWFARNIPSIAVNGRYSTKGSFVTPAPPCF